MLSFLCLWLHTLLLAVRPFLRPFPGKLELTKPTRTGIRSSLLADYIHTFALFAIILAFQFTVYATSDKIGSPSAMYEKLVEAGKKWPVDGNKDGSYLTFNSRTGMIFMVSFLCVLWVVL